MIIEIGNREVIGDIDKRIFSGVLRIRENEKRGNRDNFEFF